MHRKAGSSSTKRPLRPFCGSRERGPCSLKRSRPRNDSLAMDSQHRRRSRSAAETAASRSRNQAPVQQPRKHHDIGKARIGVWCVLPGAIRGRKAGRVSALEWNVTCPAPRGPLLGEPAGEHAQAWQAAASAPGQLHTAGFSAVLTHQQHKTPARAAARAFCIAYVWSNR